MKKKAKKHDKAPELGAQVFVAHTTTPDAEPEVGWVVAHNEDSTVNIAAFNRNGIAIQILNVPCEVTKDHEGYYMDGDKVKVEQV